jgi:bifunctional DNase/RNase
MTHDLMRDLLTSLDRPLESVTITDLRDGVFYAELAFPGGVSVSARPSDAIALAMRTGAVIRSSESVLAEAGIAIPDEQEDEVEKFREFLDNINPEDFEHPSGS